MFRLDEEFLEQLGLGDLPPESRHELLQRTYRELEIRVGERLTAGVSDDRLCEFDCFLEMSERRMEDWFAKYVPDYKERDDFKQLRAASPQDPAVAAMSDYGQIQWLQRNRPDFPDVVADVLDDLRLEVMEYAVPIRARYSDKGT